MKLSHLKSLIKTGAVDTVMVGFPDPFGRLVGKRCTADHFLESVLRHGSHGCSYLLTVNLDMDPLDGFAVANWDAGFGDFTLRPDLATLRVIPWQPASALVICDCLRHDGSVVAEAPRSVLRRQLDGVRRLGLTAVAASELEFYLFNHTYHDAFANGYRDLTPSSDYRIDYHLMQPTRDEPLMRAIRSGMNGAGIPIESSKGEWGRGQHEVNFTWAEPIETADRHVIFKQGVRELAQQHGKSISFMAKYAPSDAGSSGHLHFSLWKGTRNAFWDEPENRSTPNVARPRPNRTSAFRPNLSASGKSAPYPGSQLFRRFLGGLLKYTPELSLFFAPTVNSYKRFQPGSWAPTRMAWAMDNRTTGYRVVGHQNGFRIENRMPGADVNPYLAFAATCAAGLAGVREHIDCGQPYQGNAYLDATLPRVPASLRDAADLLDASRLARAAFGDAVVDFYVRHARIEHQAFHDAVTDWERQRYFEQI